MSQAGLYLFMEGFAGARRRPATAHAADESLHPS
jgi:hypothetical protein